MEHQTLLTIAEQTGSVTDTRLIADALGIRQGHTCPTCTTRGRTA